MNIIHNIIMIFKQFLYNFFSAFAVKYVIELEFVGTKTNIF